MTTNFTQVPGGMTIDFGNVKVEIQKVQKFGTKRFFFRPTVNGQNISRTLFARLYDAKRVARMYATR